MQVVEIGVDTCRSRCVHGNVRFGEKWGKGEGRGGVRVELKVMVESWDNDGMVVPSSAIVVLGRGSSLRRKMMSSVLVTLISQFLGHPRELIKLETVQSLESLGSSNKYMSVLEKVIMKMYRLNFYYQITEQLHYKIIEKKTQIERKA